MKRETIDLENSTILITGAAGFIGASLALRLLGAAGEDGSGESGKTAHPKRIVGIDDLNDYYDPALKEYRLRRIAAAAERESRTEWQFRRCDVADEKDLREVFREFEPDAVVHLAAQAGVRYSIDHPDRYIRSNVVGFYRILEECRHSRTASCSGVKHLVYASSSSVYGGRYDVPFKESDRADDPVSLYAATKRSDELLAASYANLYGIPCTGLRFFTAYGPAGRPDMFYYLAAERFRNGGSVRLFNRGQCERDFTYIDDITEGLLRVLKSAPAEHGASGENHLHTVYNIGRGRPVPLMELIRTLADVLKESGVLPETFDPAEHWELAPMQDGDVPVTFADMTRFEADFGPLPGTDLREGLREFARWYRAYENGRDR